MKIVDKVLSIDGKLSKLEYVSLDAIILLVILIIVVVFIYKKYEKNIDRYYNAKRISKNSEAMFADLNKNHEYLKISKNMPIESS